MDPIDFPRPSDRVEGMHWDPYKGAFVPNLTDDELAHLWPNASKQAERQTTALLNDRGEMTTAPGLDLVEKERGSTGGYPVRMLTESDTSVKPPADTPRWPKGCEDRSGPMPPMADVEWPVTSGYPGRASKEDFKAVAKDNVNLPVHYARYVIEPIRFICENKLDWFQGNTVKYTCRHDAKNGIEDIDKAIRYLQMYKQFLLGNPDWWRYGKPEDFATEATAVGAVSNGT